MRRFTDVLGGLMEKGIAKGRIRDMPVDHLTAVSRAILHMTILDELATEARPAPGFLAEEIFGLFLCGVGNLPNYHDLSEKFQWSRSSRP